MAGGHGPLGGVALRLRMAEGEAFEVNLARSIQPAAPCMLIAADLVQIATVMAARPQALVWGPPGTSRRTGPL
jgi:hypothetical protein